MLFRSEQLSSSMEWHHQLAEWVTQFARHGWPSFFGHLVGNMVSTPSVAFLLAMERKNKLNQLIRATQQHIEDGDTSWRIVRAGIRVAWPGKLMEVLNISNLVNTKVVTTKTCPITLCECVDPVVASDGHTYERDAIMHYMLTADKSPVTKTPLQHILYRNFAVYQS